ncbi:MAG: hypothetical protein ACC645_12100 [Pirellulales bacterium]
MPPSIVLEVMKVLEKEIALREETRSLEKARPAVSDDVYGERAAPLAELQSDLAERVARVVEKIQNLSQDHTGNQRSPENDGGGSDIGTGSKNLPESEAKFGREILLLTRVEQVMRETHVLLTQPETGPTTIAAETEAIELLLQARRVNPKGGGGGGGSSPGAGGSGKTDQSALALIGSGAERGAKPAVRAVQQATGVSGQQFPDEFRSGLDAYFGALERNREK